MIGSSSGTEHGNVVAFPDPDKIHAKLFAQFVRDQVATLFGAEHTMNQNIGICVGHDVPSLRGLIVSSIRFPGTAVPGFHIPPLRGCTFGVAGLRSSTVFQKGKGAVCDGCTRNSTGGNRSTEITTPDRRL
jgi:hypothetical protein